MDWWMAMNAATMEFGSDQPTIEGWLKSIYPLPFFRLKAQKGYAIKPEPSKRDLAVDRQTADTDPSFSAPRMQPWSCRLAHVLSTRDHH